MVVYEIKTRFDPDHGDLPYPGEAYEVFWTSKRDALKAARDIAREYVAGAVLSVKVTKLTLLDLTPAKLAVAALNFNTFLKNFAPEGARDILLEAEIIWTWESKHESAY